MTVKFKIQPYIEFYLEIRGIRRFEQLPPTYSVPIQKDIEAIMFNDGEFPSTKPESTIIEFELDTTYEPYYKFRGIK